MSVSITRKFWTYSGALIHDGVIVKAQLWYKHVADNPVVGTIAVPYNLGNRAFSISESGLYYFYLGVGDDALAYDQVSDEVFEVESYGSDANDGIYLVKDATISSTSTTLSWASLVSGGNLVNRTAFGDNMSVYQGLMMIRSEGDHITSHEVFISSIGSSAMTIGVHPTSGYTGSAFHVDVALIRE